MVGPHLMLMQRCLGYLLPNELDLGSCIEGKEDNAIVLATWLDKGKNEDIVSISPIHPIK